MSILLTLLVLTLIAVAAVLVHELGGDGYGRRVPPVSHHDTTPRPAQRWV